MAKIKKTDEKPDTTNLKHLAFIMDGNGRWAKKRGLKREIGHIYGAKVTKRLMEYCNDIGIHCVTIYAFSTENWKRPQNEVDALMKLFASYIDDFLQHFDQYHGRFHFIGDVSVFPPEILEKMRRIEEMTKHYPNILNVAMNYGSRAEIVHAVNDLIAEGKTTVSEEDISRHLYTGECPDPDMIVRTGGDLRLSNFLLWQSEYSELYFTDILWPDLKESDIDEIVREFNRRKRRYGGV